MGIRQRETSTPLRRLFGLLILNRYLFTMHFLGDSFTVPASRHDLPERLRGRRLMTLEQRLMLLDDSPAVVYCTSRKVGKTCILEAWFFWYALTSLANAKDSEALLFTPREHHLRPLEQRLRLRCHRIPLFTLLLRNWNSSDGIVEFPRTTFYLRIEGAGGTGQNFVGLRAEFAMGDEMGYFSQGAWPELQNTFTPGAKRIFAGVPRGMRDTPFYRMTETKTGQKGLSVHRANILASPLYHSREALVDEAVKHGGVRTQGFVTQVLGQWGEEAYATFPTLPVASFPFNHRAFLGKEAASVHFRNLLKFPIRKEEGYERFILAADIGLTASPTCLLVFGYKEGTWWERARLIMRNTDTAQIAELVDYVNMHLLPQRADLIALDAHGIGTGVLSFFHSPTSAISHNDNYARKVFDAGFSGLVRDPNIVIHRACGNRVRGWEAEGQWVCHHCGTLVGEEDITYGHIPAKQHYMETLKDLFARGQKWLDAGRPVPAAHLQPRVVLARDDDAAQEELGGVTEVRSPSGYIRYVPGREGESHITDAFAAFASALLAQEGHLDLAEGQLTSYREWGWVPNPFLGERTWRAWYT